MKRFILLFLVVLLVGCQKTETLKLVELEGTDIDEVDRFVELYEAMDVKGDIKGSIVVKDLNHDVNGYHMYQSEVDYAWSYGIVLEKDDELIMLPSGYLPEVYEMDSNGDEKPELLLVGDIGSGLRILQMTHFDTETGEITIQTFYNNNDGIVFDVVDGEIMAYHDYSFGKRSTDPIGKLIIGDDIEIEGFENTHKDAFIDKEENNEKDD